MFLNYIHNFRAAAILFIVAGHCIDAFNWENNKLAYNILCFSLKNGTVLFVFISGFLFQHLSYKYDAKKYFKNKIRYVLLPYVIVSIPAVIMLTFFYQRPDMSPGFYENPIPVQIIMFYLTGDHITPFWFIPMITLFYIISPLLIWLDNEKHIYYLIPFFILVSIIVPRGGGILKNFVHFFSVYLFGMCCSRYKEAMIRIINKYFGMLFVLYALIVIAGIINREVSISTIQCLNYLSKLIVCLLLVSIFHKYEDIIKGRGDYLASISFGIYFIHSYVIQSVRLSTSGIFGNSIPVNGSIILHLLLCIFVVTMCCLIIMSFKRISGKYSRFVIGC